MDRRGDTRRKGKGRAVARMDEDEEEFPEDASEARSNGDEEDDMVPDSEDEEEVRRRRERLARIDDEDSSDDEEEDIVARFQAYSNSMVNYPISRSLLHPSHARSFAATAGRLAKTYINCPSSHNLLSILQLPKLGLTIGLRPEVNFKRHLASFPNVSLPPAPLAQPTPSVSPPLAKRIEKLVSQGRLSSAASALSSQSPRRNERGDHPEALQPSP
jgi:hypothetical protein